MPYAVAAHGAISIGPQSARRLPALSSANSTRLSLVTMVRSGYPLASVSPTRTHLPVLAHLPTGVVVVVHQPAHEPDGIHEGRLEVAFAHTSVMGRVTLAMRLIAPSKYSGFRSSPTPRLPRDWATDTLVPEQTKGSRTLAGATAAL